MNPSRIAELLLSCGVISLRPDEPFLFTSGIKSPIYCDHRVLLSFVSERLEVVRAWANLLRDEKIEQVAGVSTAGIPWAAWLAQELRVPMLYVRAKPKDYGHSKLIEGVLNSSLKTAVIEDLISTGKSSLAVVNALRGAECDRLLVSSVFSYGFLETAKKFEEANVELSCLVSLKNVLDLWVEQAHVSLDQVNSILAWQKSPQTWGF